MPGKAKGYMKRTSGSGGGIKGAQADLRSRLRGALGEAKKSPAGKNSAAKQKKK